MNHIVIKGRIVHTPEVKTTTSDIKVCTFSVAVDRKYKSGGEKVTDFFDCVAWRGTAEIIEKYFTKGQEILLSGEMQSRSYEAKDGSKRRAWEINVENVEFCGGKQQSAEPSGTNAPASAKADIFETTEDVDGDDLPF